MQTLRKIYQDTPSLLQIEIPVALQDHVVEVTIRLVEYANNAETDANGWPIGFFEATAGCLADDPIERAPLADCRHCPSQRPDIGYPQHRRIQLD